MIVYNNLELDLLLKYKIFFGEIHERKKISTLIGKYVNVIDFFYIGLLFLSVTCPSITTASFMQAIGVPDF